MTMITALREVCRGSTAWLSYPHSLKIRVQQDKQLPAVSATALTTALPIRPDPAHCMAPVDGYCRSLAGFSPKSGADITAQGRWLRALIARLLRAPGLCVIASYAAVASRPCSPLVSQAKLVTAVPPTMVRTTAPFGSLTQFHTTAKSYSISGRSRLGAIGFVHCLAHPAFPVLLNGARACNICLRWATTRNGAAITLVHDHDRDRCRLPPRVTTYSAPDAHKPGAILSAIMTLTKADNRRHATACRYLRWCSADIVFTPAPDRYHSRPAAAPEAYVCGSPTGRCSPRQCHTRRMRRTVTPRSCRRIPGSEMLIPDPTIGAWGLAHGDRRMTSSSAGKIALPTEGTSARSQCQDDSGPRAFSRASCERMTAAPVPSRVT
jgi:hypothetical protein